MTKLLHDPRPRAHEGGLLLALLVTPLACSTERGSAGVWDPGSHDGSEGDGSSGDGGDDGDDDGGDGGGDSGDDSSDDSGGGVKYDVGEEMDVGGGGALPPTCEEAAELETNQGCEFWAVDLPQVWWSEQDGLIPPEDDTYAVAVANASSNVDAEVEIFEGATSTLVDSASIPVGQVHVFELPPLNIEPQASSTGGMAYRVESSVPVTAYQFNTLEQSTARFSADASLLFPTPVLRGDYTTFTGDAIYGMHGDQGAYISVVGVEDGTTVDVFPTATLMPGAPEQGVVIDRGQVYTVISESLGGPVVPGEGNLTGSRIVADKPVAVFSGNVATGEPVGEMWTCCSDHLEEQMLPLEAWGQSYLIAPPVNPENNGTNSIAAYRMVGGEDGISLTYAPATPAGAPAVLDAYEVAYFVTDQAFTVEGSRPFGVAQFHPGIGANPWADYGDPAMIVLPAQDQLQDIYVFLVPPTYNLNFVSVVRPVGTTTTLDGATVTEPATPIATLGDSEYEFVQVLVEEGAHSIEGEEPFEILVYGYADAASYGYPGGSGLKFIDEPPPPPEG